MSVGNFIVVDEFIEGTGIAGLNGVSVYAVLLNVNYTPNNADHATYADVSGDEVSGGDYDQLQLTGVSVVDIAGGARYTTGNASWGSTVTIPESKYIAHLIGDASSPQSTDKLVGYQDLDTTSGTAVVSSTNGQFAVNAPTNGWFESKRA